MYTNVDGLVLSLLEFKDCLNINKPNVVCLMENKLKDEINLGFRRGETEKERKVED